MYYRSKHVVGCKILEFDVHKFEAYPFNRCVIAIFSNIVKVIYFVIYISSKQLFSKSNCQTFGVQIYTSKFVSLVEYSGMIHAR